MPPHVAPWLSITGAARLSPNQSRITVAYPSGESDLRVESSGLTDWKSSRVEGACHMKRKFTLATLQPRLATTGIDCGAES